MRRKYIFSLAIIAFIISACNNTQSDSSSNSISIEDKSPTVVEELMESSKNQSDSQAEGILKSSTTVELLSKGSIKVNGAADIEGFTKAILSVSHGYYYSSETVLKEIDGGLNKKAGYWSNEEIRVEGDPRQYCCYWTRDDKKKLVCFSELDFRDGPEEGYTEPIHCFCFFVYNETTRELEPIDRPIDKSIDCAVDETVIIKLPEVGKDIQFYSFSTYYDEDRQPIAILKWNGMGFNVECLDNM